ncbi:MAG: DUF342 domain-containing protein [Bacillota bacterium]
MQDERRKNITIGLEMLLDLDGLYLVFEPGTRATVEDVVKFIREEQIYGISLDAMRAAFLNRSSGHVKLCDRASLVFTDASAQVQVSGDGLSANLVLNRAGFGGQSITRRQLDELLTQAHVVFGIDTGLLDRVASGEVTQGTHIVATGMPPSVGAPAKLFFHVAERNSDTDDLRVDHRELGKIQNVEVGDILVTKTPAEAGTPGTTVTGFAIAARPGRDCPLTVGKGVVPSADGLRLYAATNGHVVFGPRRVEVLPSFEVAGDVDFASGNIDVNGNAVIHGNVHSGFRVTAQGHVEIAGWVDNAQIRAGGHIKVQGGVQGQRSVLTAGGCISVKYVENGQMAAGESIIVGEAIMHSRVIAGGKVAVEGRKGLIVGGSVRAGEEIHAKVVGSPLATPTELEVGIDPAIKDEYTQIAEECRRLNEHLDKSEKAIALLTQIQERAGNLPQDKLVLLSQLRLGVKANRVELDARTARRLELEAMINQAQDGKVRVKDTIHPGVRVTIGASAYRVRDPMAGATFKRLGADVTVLPY